MIFRGVFTAAWMAHQSWSWHRCNAAGRVDGKKKPAQAGLLAGSIRDVTAGPL